MGIVIHNINVGKGDCLLIISDNYKILVDCGKYNDNVKRTFKECNVDALDLVIATHIDNDHIEGLIEVLQNVEVKNILFNGFCHIPLENSAKEKFTPPSEIITALKNYSSYSNFDMALEHSVNAKQSLFLSDIIINRDISWNSCVENTRLSIDNTDFIKINIDKIIITLLSPDDDALIKTYKEYRKFIHSKLSYELDKNKKEDISDSLYDVAIKEDNSFIDEYPINHYMHLTEQLIKKYSNKTTDIDMSASNCASLAFILEIEDKKILMLGDSNPDIVVKGIKKLQLHCPLIFDVIKISHHGSSKNTTTELLSLIDSNTYVFCGGGKDKPSEYTISKIINRPSIGGRILYFNRQNDIIEHFDASAEMKSKFNYSIDVKSNSIEL